jgi:tetratricopeptide (TPR) repeat protein
MFGLACTASVNCNLQQARNCDQHACKASRHAAYPLATASVPAPAGQAEPASSRSPLCSSRRAWLATATSLAAGALVPMPSAAAASSASAARQRQELQAAAAAAYANRDFDAALAALDELVRQEPQELRWREMRAQALVDAKNFNGALDDFDLTLKRLPAEAQVDRARLLSGAPACTGAAGF